MTESFFSRFEAILGNLDSWPYGDLIRSGKLSSEHKLNSPVNKIVEELIADCTELLSYWRLDESVGYEALSSFIWHLDGGRLAEALKAVDKLMTFVANEKLIDLPRPRPRVLESYEAKFSGLLILLSRLARDESVSLVEELMGLAAIRTSLMTRAQTAAVEKARTLADEVWHFGGSYRLVGEFRGLVEPILESVYPLAPRNLSCMKTDDAHRLLAELKKVHEDMEVMELWDNLTSA